jgi:phenylacetate-coenzyme A ligase PaaK-like adenylate-forming protein
MRLVAERAEGVAAARSPELAHEAVHQIKRQLMVTVDLELVDYGSLPRSERKSQRVFDSRIQDEIV